MTLPLVSVIIPTYNRPRLVERAIESVLGQSLTDFEVLIIDDGSDGDEVERFVSRQKDPRVKYLFKENGGVSSARNAGLERAAGEFVCFLDDDDEWPKEYLSTMVTTLRESEDYGVAYCSWTVGEGCDRSMKVLPSGQITTALFKKGIVHIIACVIRRGSLGDLRFDTMLKIAEDSDFLLRLSLRAEFLFVPTVTAIHNETEVCLTSIYDECRVLSLERFYFRLGGDKIIPRSVATKKLSKSCRSVARHYYKRGIPRAARYFYGKAISYRVGDLRNYAPYAKALIKSINTKGWRPKATLPVIPEKED